MTKVLLISNDSTLKHFVNLTLGKSGFLVHSAVDSRSGWLLLQEIRFDCILIDYQLSDESGLSFYKSLRQFGATTPIIMIGENAFDEFMLKDLSFHNYDYLLKPFKLELLRIKMNALISTNITAEKFVTYGNLKIDLRQQMVMVKDRFIQLGSMEMRILILLAKKSGEVVDLKKMRKVLKAEGSFYSMTTFYYVSKLRKKMKHLLGEAFEISLINNQGYKLVLKV